MKKGTDGFNDKNFVDKNFLDTECFPNQRNNFS